LLGGLLRQLQHARLQELLDDLVGQLLDNGLLGQLLDERVRLRLLLGELLLLDLLHHGRVLYELLDDLQPNELLGDPVCKVLRRLLLNLLLLDLLLLDLFDAESARAPTRLQPERPAAVSPSYGQLVLVCRRCGLRVRHG